MTYSEAVDVLRASDASFQFKPKVRVYPPPSILILPCSGGVTSIQNMNTTSSPTLDTAHCLSLTILPHSSHSMHEGTVMERQCVCA